MPLITCSRALPWPTLSSVCEPLQIFTKGGRVRREGRRGARAISFWRCSNEDACGETDIPSVLKVCVSVPVGHVTVGWSRMTGSSS